MRIVLFLCCFFCATLVWSQDWERGTVTRQMWVDQGGFHVEINGTQYLFMRDAKLQIDDVEYELADRMTWIATKSRVQYVRDGFRIYDLILERRN